MPLSLLVSRETQARLSVLCDMVERWNRSINLVSLATIPQLRQRHVEDSSQLVPFLPEGARLWVDLGSGAGFPGLVVAAHLTDIAPDCAVTLIESDQRKAVFLREASRAMKVKTMVLASRIEQVSGQAADVISARALAPLPHLLFLTRIHLKPHGVALFLKGQDVAAELNDAVQDGWKFDATQHKSATDPAGTILTVRNLTRDSHP
jgi:16S rRNA (guanine527-N7)-methyltransferase